jgi:CRP-like cAMP-binding protein
MHMLNFQHQRQHQHGSRRHRPPQVVAAEAGHAPSPFGLQPAPHALADRQDGGIGFRHFLLMFIDVLTRSFSATPHRIRFETGKRIVTGFSTESRVFVDGPEAGDDVSVIGLEVFRGPRQARSASNSLPPQSSELFESEALESGALESEAMESEALDRFSRVMARAGIAIKVVACKTDEAIYQAGDGADNVYQVVSGAVRSLTPFSEGPHNRIDAYYLPGQLFGLEFGSIHGSAAEAAIDTTLRLVSRSSIEQAAKLDAQLARELWSMTADRAIVRFDRTPQRALTSDTSRRALSCGPASVVALAPRLDRLSAVRAAGPGEQMKEAAN